MRSHQDDRPPVTGRLVGRPTGDLGDPDGRAIETTGADMAAEERRQAALRDAAGEAGSVADPDAASVGLLGEARLGDETAALGADAPTQGVANDYDDRPSQRRIGEGLAADGLNFQGRPDASMSGGGDSTSSGGGSGL